VRALVLGGADSVWNDVAASEQTLGCDWWDVVVAANDIGVAWPRTLDHWCSLHPNKLERWRTERTKRALPGPAVTWTKKGKRCRGVDREVTHRFGGGSSGLLTVSVARAVGADRIVLCGVPMTKTGYFKESTEHRHPRNFSSADAHWRKWRLHAEELSGYVRSMGGRTRELLGAPTPEWMEATDEAA
jgi:hypothetical protein